MPAEDGRSGYDVVVADGLAFLRARACRQALQPLLIGAKLKNWSTSTPAHGAARTIRSRNDSTPSLAVGHDRHRAQRSNASKAHA